LISPYLLLAFLAGYFCILLAVAHVTSRTRADNAAFFVANKSSRWYVVAFGMIGVALSGMTFISVPGAVGNTKFSYFQFVLGCALGFITIALVLLPIYYRLNLTSIYTYLEKRFGRLSYKTGAMIFLVSRTIGSALRLYLVAIILQRFVFDDLGVPFALTVASCLLLIWLYTNKGGLKTIIITDTMQTACLLLAVLFSIYFIADGMGLSVMEALEKVKDSGYSQMVMWDDFWGNKTHFWKHLLGGFFVTLGMVGLDQDLMQKNISMKTIGEAQKNMLVFTGIFIVINLFFLCVGALLYLYAQEQGIDVGALRTPDYLYPEIALNHLSLTASLVFMLGVTAATFASTDSALTALTTSYCVDFLNFDKKTNPDDPALVRQRNWVHGVFSLIMLLVILVFRLVNDDSVVTVIFMAVGYTYGPLLGLFAFGVLTRYQVRDTWVPWFCLVSPVLLYLANTYLVIPYTPYRAGFEIIVYNALLTCGLLWVTSPGKVKAQGLGVGPSGL